MPLFLHQWSYKDDQVEKMILEPQNRAEIVRAAVRAFDGELISFFYCFGDYDGMAIARFPDNQTALACCMSIFAGGRLAGVKTTPLFDPDEGVAAMTQAAKALDDSGN